MLTTPSSVLGISPAVMDTSNWRWGALSLGPAAGAFNTNAYFYPEDQTYIKVDDLCNGVSADVTSFITQIGNDGVRRVLQSPGVDGSSYVPPYHLPSYPDPMDTKLEDANTAYTDVSADGTESFGQFENRIEFAPNDASSYFQGAWPPAGNTNTSAMVVSSYEADWQTTPYSNLIVSNAPITTQGQPNTAKQIDYRGFYSLTYTNDAASFSKVQVSGSIASNDPQDMVVDPRVSVYVNLEFKAIWAFNLYGGLHQLGLWNMDPIRASLANSAPFLEDNGDFIDSNGVTKQEFKLFAKKTFTENLCKNIDNGTAAGFLNHKTMKVVWTLDLRANHA